MTRFLDDKAALTKYAPEFPAGIAGGGAGIALL
jgi:hypothetical protein